MDFAPTHLDGGSWWSRSADAWAAILWPSKQPRPQLDFFGLAELRE
ncbi:MAG: hypothetical protein R3A10_14955 [Caldilineaceae bacterium]